MQKGKQTTLDLAESNSATFELDTNDPFEYELIELVLTHRSKAKDYGSDEDNYANLRAAQLYGISNWVGCVLRANDKVYRIQQFVRRGKLENESVDDSLLDAAIYFILARVLKRETKS
jgi:hypothetical protein